MAAIMFTCSLAIQSQWIYSACVYNYVQQLHVIPETFLDSLSPDRQITNWLISCDRQITNMIFDPILNVLLYFNENEVP